MVKEITINPVTRIEGHAKVTIFLDDDGSVKDARFQINFFRGFEKFCEGRPYYEMPSITSRACGICPVSHLIASAKACDALVSVTIPEAAVRLRRLMHMGQIIQSHTLSFFYLSFPDLLFGMDADIEKRNIFGLIESDPEIAKNGIKLRKFGQEIIERLAGKRIHSSDWIVPGGVRWPLTKEKGERIAADLPEAKNITISTLEKFRNMLQRFDEEIEHLGNFPSNYMGLITPDGELEHYDGLLKIIDYQGEVIADSLDPTKYKEFIAEAVEPWSYMKFPYYKPLGYPGGSYRVGPLARLNIAKRCGTPLADEEIKEFRKFGKNGIVESSFLYHYARLIEILFCLERAEEILSEPETYADRVWAKAEVSRSEGIGVAEAPRGTLIHHYKVDENGLITWVNLIIATGHNNVAFNRAVTEVAKKYVNAKKLTEGMLNRVEAVIRAYDPCLSCASHSFGSRGIDFELYDADGRLIDRNSR
ncbi:MAG: Ni/Fe hydrogenase subunit alpha [Methanomassiliicoccales archaeon]|jgi:NAD-reducing hydrogenase large subunit|nr:Ni/Fe hydrogenase subunit alpha [Methanomassiliicoccales archaeon]